MNDHDLNIMLDSCGTRTIVNEDVLQFLQVKKLNSTKVVIENLHGEEEYPTRMVEIKLPNDTIIKAYSIKKDLVSLETDDSSIIKTWPNLDKKILKELLQNAYNGPTHIPVGQDNLWKFELTNIITHKDKTSGLICTKFGWSACGNISCKTSGWPQKLQKEGPIREISQMKKLHDIETMEK